MALKPSRIFVFILVLALTASGVATIAFMVDYAPLKSDLTSIIVLLNVDLVLALLLGAFLVRRIVRAWTSRRYGSAGSRLHIRLVVSFSLVAIIPAILVAVFSGLFLNFGIESWFSERVRTAVNESSAVAKLYLGEHRRNISVDALAMANDINRVADQLRDDPSLFNRLVSAQAAIRGLPEAAVVTGSGRTLAQTELSFSLGFDFTSNELMNQVLRGRPGTVTIINDRDDDRVRAGIKLRAFSDTYLLVGRFVDRQVLDHLSRTRGAVVQYNQLEKSRDSLQVKFVFVFALVAVLLLIAAVWIGWSIATQLATPISDLIRAAEQVRDGDLDVRVDDSKSKSNDEIGMLSRAFNRMTEQLDNQQKGLIEANRQLDERRRFTETVLAGVSAGVIGLDSAGNIHLPNRSASELLGISLDRHVSEPLDDVVPEMAALLNDAMKYNFRNAQGEIRVNRAGRQRTLIVSVAAEKIEKEVIGFVVTFDDVTELFSAQRKAAWADVARRIAHEIKNPLTPIQLSAERLKRKYLKQITSDPETFIMCTDTIVRQVEDIGRMVDEFSSFARMPQPELKDINIIELCRQSIFLERNRYPSIDYDASLPAGELMLRCDRLQIGRAITNILKNAAEAIDGDSDGDGNRDGSANGAENGKIEITLSHDDNTVSINISDNGQGFPEELLDRITEPYVTTREKGTGLGLAIAKKIMEDHNGELLLRNNTGEEGDGGACATLVFKQTNAIVSPPPDEPREQSKNSANDANKDSVPVMTATETN